MPYKKVRNHGKCPASKPVAVVKKDGGKVMGCHATDYSANRQLAALYVAEDKKKEKGNMAHGKVIELDPRTLNAILLRSDEEDEGQTEEDGEVKEKGLYMEPDSGHYPLYGATSFEELDDLRGVQELNHHLYSIVSDYQMMMENITYDPEITDAIAALRKLNDEFVDRLEKARTDMGDEHKSLLKSMGESPDDLFEDDLVVDEEDVFKESWDTAYKNDLPDSAFLYVEPGGKKDESGKTVPRSKRHLVYRNSSGKVDLPHLRNALSRLGQSKTGTGDGWLSSGLRSKLRAKAERLLKSSQEKELSESPDPAGDVGNDGNNFMVWKSADGWRWMAAYSNGFRDKEDEIITSGSHELYVKMVDEGIIPYPELWLWHLPLQWGQADWVDYDDGFALASGSVLPGYEYIAKELSGRDDIAVSHGMPKKLLAKNPDDEREIVFHVTKEISPLPVHKAANGLTAFILDKELEMPIKKEKKEFLLSLGVPEDKVKDLEAMMANKAKEAKDAGMDFKEDKAEDTQDQPETTADDGQSQLVTRAEVAEVVSEMIQAMGESFKELNEGIARLSGELELQRKELKDATSLTKEAVANTPPASLRSLIAQSVIGKEDTQVKEGDGLAGMKPKEAEQKESGLFFQEWLKH